MKKYILNILTSLVALIALGFSLCKVTPFEVTEETYIGIIATFIGISVTLLIGYQIYSAVEIKRKIAKIEMLETSLHEQQILNEQNLHRSEGNLLFVQGQTILFQSIQVSSDKAKNICLTKSFISFHSALAEFLLSDLNKIDSVFENMRNCIKDLSDCSISDDDRMCINNFSQIIRQSANYCLISKRYEELLSAFLTKCLNH